MTTKSIYITPRAVPYCSLAIATAFKALSPQNRLYAHYMMRAGWCGLPICASQVSPESLPILRFFFNLFTTKPVEMVKAEAVRSGVSEDEVAQFLEYAALVYTNSGNYLSFGDSKFIPSCSRDVFEKIVKSVSAERDLSSGLVDSIYGLAESQLALGFPPKGISSYYSSNISEEDVAVVNRYLISKNIHPINTRVWKDEGGDALTVRIASVKEKSLPEEKFEGRSISLVYGDFKEELQSVVEALQNAKKHARRPIQERMIDHYVDHFITGDVEAHKESQKEWVRDVGPDVETNQGFIETYRDPSGVRAEWEGFVAVVNKDQSKKYAALVANAESFIAKLPWGKGFEKDSFSSPDFTSLEVLGFASSGIPVGICIPNYDDIRQEFGFKNVYLANVVSAINFDEKINHLSNADWEVYKRSFESAMSVNVGIHELLGHGTGKLLSEKEDGTRNFDSNLLIDPLTGKPVTTWYKPGETWGSVFGGASNAYEECRAEAVALYLSVIPELLNIFGIDTESNQKDTIFVCWLNMVRAGLVGLEFYTPESKQWRQAHMRARYAILRSLLRSPNSIVSITADANEGLRITLDGDRIKTDGLKAIGELLVNLNVNKATANAERGLKYFGELTEVSDEHVQLRGIILEKRKPRKQYVQAHTVVSADGSDVTVEEFDSSVEGVLRSLVSRHRDVKL